MASLVHYRSSVDAKIALFRSLFRGRDDVYARRFESRKTGKAGYAPACENEWVRGICEKPQSEVRRVPATAASCRSPTRSIRRHLSGQDDDGRAS